MEVPQKKELNEVYLLRGVASLMVCLFHLILGNGELFPSDNFLEQTFLYGYLGVEIFFVLSGYVICYSLPNNFNYKNLGTFLLKRIVRIEPPYLVSIFLVILLNSISHKITGLPDKIDWMNLLYHIAYLNNFNASGYLNVVYWTLGIEFQFYLLIGFLFPIIKSTPIILVSVLCLLVGMGCISLYKTNSVILPYLSFFSIGILLYFFKIKQRIGQRIFIFLLLLCLVQLYFFQGLPAMITAIFTSLIILYWNYTNRFIKFFSTISFSLYLTHVVVGGKIINLGMRFTHNNSSRYLLVLIAVCISILFSYIFYKLIELPAFKISKKIKYKGGLSLKVHKPIIIKNNISV